MVSLLALFVFIGFYFWYAGSERVKPDGVLGVESLIRKHSYIGKTVGTAFLILSCSLSVLYLGFGAGIFTFFILLMTLGSLIILLAPLGLLNYKTLLPVLALMLFVEIILF
jgi:hypothetical protein